MSEKKQPKKPLFMSIVTRSFIGLLSETEGLGSDKHKPRYGVRQDIEQNYG